MNKMEADEKMLKLCAQFVREAENLYGAKLSLENPCGVAFWIFGKNTNTVFASGKIDAAEILNFLAARCGFKIELVTASSPKTKHSSLN